MPEYTLTVLDTYTVTSSAKQFELLSRLRQFADIQSYDGGDAELSAYLWSAALFIHPNISSFEELAPKEDWACVMWAAIQIIDSRLMNYSKYFPIDSRVGKTDPSKRVEMLVKVKQAFMKQFDEYIENAGINLAGDIVQGTLYRKDLILDITIPSGTQDSPLALSIQLVFKDSTNFTIGWKRSTINDFSCYNVYISDTPNIADPVQATQTANAGVRAGLQPILTVDEQWLEAARISDLAAGVYYVVVGVQDFNGRQTLSNELTVVIP